jgi:hypothetical protein
MYERIANTLIVISSLLFVYGYSVYNRPYCVICHDPSPCLTTTDCKPNNIEGHILKALIPKLK